MSEESLAPQSAPPSSSGTTMSLLSELPADLFSSVSLVLTGMDETLAFRGRVAAATYHALEHLQAAGVVVMLVTAAPAGWCDQMARTWPIDGVIGENGGLFVHREPNGVGVMRRYFLAPSERTQARAQLARIEQSVREAAPWALHDEDQPLRLTSVAYRQPLDPERSVELEAILRRAGAQVSRNNLWILGWVGAYDRLAMVRRVLSDTYDLDVEVDGDRVLYCGDAVNDASMFGVFRHTVGVSTVRDHLAVLPAPPRWITQGPGWTGFVETAQAVISARRGAQGTTL